MVLSNEKEGTMTHQKNDTQDENESQASFEARVHELVVGKRA